jgi:hypothetical protein
MIPDDKEKLIKEFHRAAIFLISRIENDGWRWTSNYLREHVRATTNLKFTNSVSPEILRELRDRWPGLRRHIKIGRLKS